MDTIKQTSRSENLDVSFSPSCYEGGRLSELRSGFVPQTQLSSEGFFPAHSSHLVQIKVLLYALKGTFKNYVDKTR